VEYVPVDPENSKVNASSSTTQVLPPSVEYSMVYPVIADPPLSGTVNVAVIDWSPTAVTVASVIAAGTPTGVNVTTFDTEDVPTALVAETRPE
jgi:hypothetical protein